MPSAPPLAVPSSAELQAPVRNLFPFLHKPNTLDRDRIVIPAGWDSWGKISVMREGFDAKMWGEAWERDLESGEGQGTGEAGAKKAYTTLVPDQRFKVNFVYVPLFLPFCSCFYSLRRCLRSTIQSQNKPSLQKTTMKIRRNQTKILEGRSETLQNLRVPLRVLLVLWEAAVSIYPMSNVL